MLHNWWKAVASQLVRWCCISCEHLCTQKVLRAWSDFSGILDACWQFSRESGRGLSNASRRRCCIGIRPEGARAERQRKRRISTTDPCRVHQLPDASQIIRNCCSGIRRRDRRTASIAGLCKAQVNELRSFVRSMRPVDVEGSLNATLRRVVEQFQKDSGIPATFVSAGVSGAVRA